MLPTLGHTAWYLSTTRRAPWADSIPLEHQQAGLMSNSGLMDTPVPPVNPQTAAGAAPQPDHSQGIASHPAASAASSKQPRSRFFGVDLARFVALIGMMATHLLAANEYIPGASEFDQGVAAVAVTLTTGISAAVFAVLGGLSMVFASRRLVQQGRIGAAIWAGIIRGALLIIIGMLLGLLLSPVVVILAYYGVAMILVSPLIAAPSWVLGTVAAVVGVVSGPVNTIVRGTLEVVNEGGSVTFESWQQPLETIRALFLTGTYPAITWAVFLLAGMLLGRALVRADQRGSLRAVAGRMALAAVGVATLATVISEWAKTALAVAPEGVDPELFRSGLGMAGFGAPISTEPWMQLIATPHSGTVAEFVQTIAIAAALIGTLVWIFDRGRPLGVISSLFRTLGAAPLTMYVTHIVLTALTLGTASVALMEVTDPAQLVYPWWAASLSAFAMQLAVILLIGTIIKATGRKGPLEALLSGTVKLATRQKTAPHS